MNSSRFRYNTSLYYYSPPPYPKVPMAFLTRFALIILPVLFCANAFAEPSADTSAETLAADAPSVVTEEPAGDTTEPTATEEVASIAEALPQPKYTVSGAEQAQEIKLVHQEALNLVLHTAGAGIASIDLTNFHPKAHCNDETYHLLSPVPGQLNSWAVAAIEIDGQMVALGSNAIWKVTSQKEDKVKLSLDILRDGKPCLRLHRSICVDSQLPYGLDIEQNIENLSDAPLKVLWHQMGQNDIAGDPASYMGDKRKYTLGWIDLKKDSSGNTISTEGGFLGRDGILKMALVDPALRDSDENGIWPHEDIVGAGTAATKLSWMACANRYFLLATLPKIDPSDTQVSQTRALETLFPSIQTRGISTGDKQGNIIFVLSTSTRTIEAGQSEDLSFSIYAGPRNDEFFDACPAYATLKLKDTVRYRLTEGFCGICTFQWLAHVLLYGLRFFEMIFRDWGIAIIFLVLCVRLLLHPITKKSQLTMMRFGKQMQAIKPQIDRLRKEFANDPSKLNAETMRLYKEKGINPAGMLGCLPMFLQMPIWIALYSMLYYAFDLRHEAAFYGIFQNIGGWQFLSDLSSPDRFISFFSDDKPRMFTLVFVKFDYSGLNVLPIVMTAVMWINMKFTTTPATTPEQEMQQKMMKIMTLVMFPLFLYGAPAGLTLYITASTMAGIADSWIVRRHLKRMEDDGSLFTKKEGPKPGSWRWKLKQRLELAKKMNQMRQQGTQAPQQGSQNPFPKGPQDPRAKR